jgi:hypothetical protein
MDCVLFDDDIIVLDKHILDLFVLCSYDQIFDNKVNNSFDVYLFDYQLHLIDDDDDHVIMTKENKILQIFN